MPATSIESIMMENIETVDVDTSVSLANNVMVEKKISCLVVVKEGKTIGVISERDMLSRIIYADRDVNGLKAKDIMTSPVYTIKPDNTLNEAMRMMQQKKCRRFPVVDDSGTLVGLITQTDLIKSSLERLQEYSTRLESIVDERTKELKKLNELKDDLTHMMVHDMKNPLTTIMVIFDTLICGELDFNSEESEEMMKLGYDSSMNLRNMIQNMLEIGKLEIGELSLNKQDVDLRNLIELSIKELGLLPMEKNITFSVSMKDGNLELYMDEELISRVMMNLLSNAIKYSPNNDKVVIEVSVNEKKYLGQTMLRVSVSNNGAGIPQEYHDKIFDKFAQVEAKKSGALTSVGLGLAFCKLAIEAHNGQIWVESPINDEGNGARLNFTLPYIS